MSKWPENIKVWALGQFRSYHTFQKCDQDPEKARFLKSRIWYWIKTHRSGMYHLAELGYSDKGEVVRFIEETLRAEWNQKSANTRAKKRKQQAEQAQLARQQRFEFSS